MRIEAHTMIELSDSGDNEHNHSFIQISNVSQREYFDLNVKALVV